MTSPLKTEAFRNRDLGDCSYVQIWRIAHEKVKVYGGADRLCAEAVGQRCPGGRDLPEDGHQRGHVLFLEEEVRWVGCIGAPGATSAQGGEHQAQADGGRP